MFTSAERDEGLGDDAADCMGAGRQQASAVPGCGSGTTRAPGPAAMERATPTADPVASARAAGLRYVSDRAPGIRRRRRGKGFAYRLPDGTPLRDRAERRRIAKLAIPPAWTDVWICPQANGHLQATGRDARGRKQYRYHPDWRDVRDETKFGRLIAFGEALPALRRRVEEDLGRQGLPREKVLAAVVRLLETTLLRVGNEEYARANNSFGLTTLRNRHAAVEGSTVRFAFRGKSGKEVQVDIQDRRGEPQRRPSGQGGRRAARQPAGDLPQVLHPSRRAGGLRRRRVGRRGGGRRDRPPAERRPGPLFPRAPHLESPPRTAGGRGVVPGPNATGAPGGAPASGHPVLAP